MLGRFLFAAMLCLSAESANATETFRDLHVTTQGTGRPVVLLHGLNSSSTTWDELCARLSRQITCYQLQTPGFAGAPFAKTDNYLTDMRDQVIAFVHERKLEQPILVGHSLGGILSMMIAIEAPSLASGILIVDALPYLPDAQSPGATTEMMRPIADLARRNLLAMTDQMKAQQAQRSARTMVRDAKYQALIEQWGLTSDPKATGDAMHAVMTTDLRADVARITVPTTVLASWSKNNPTAGTREATQQTFAKQYDKLSNVRIVTTEDANHFIMWDDPQLTDRELSQLLTRTKESR